MSGIVEVFSLPYMQRAALVLLLLAVMGAVVGVHVYLRRLAFLTEALQHTVFPGIAVAYVLDVSLLWGALAAGLSTVWLLVALTTRSRLNQDTLLALVVTLFFAGGVMLVSRSSGFQHDLTVLLFGRVLAVDSAQLLQTGVIAVVVVATLLMLHKELVLRAFDPAASEAQGYRPFFLDVVVNLCVALVVIAAVRAVGSVLVVAFVVTPAVTARLLTARVGPMMAVAAATTAAASLGGLMLSHSLSVNQGIDAPPGATVVACITVLLLLVAGGRAVLRSRTT